MSEREEQIVLLKTRWMKIAGTDAESPKWAPPSELTWAALMEKVPFVVLYEDVLRRLRSFRHSVKADAVTYMRMIVDRNGPDFMNARGLSRVLPPEDDVPPDAVPTFLSKGA
jgi:hypothetical protein